MTTTDRRGLAGQLCRVTTVLTGLRVAHTICYGTLLGALRLNGNNPNEIDNDVAVDLAGAPSDWKTHFESHALRVVPQGSVFKVCRTPSRGDVPRPAHRIVLFVDLSPRDHRYFERPLRLAHVRNMTFRITNASLLELGRYGNYSSVPRRRDDGTFITTSRNGGKRVMRERARAAYSGGAAPGLANAYSRR